MNLHFDSAVHTDRLTHHYGRHVALSDVSLKIPEHSCYGLLGPNGCGKTTLLKILATLLIPTSGAASVWGANIRANPQFVRRRLGIIFQDTALDGELTLRENLFTHAALYGLRRSVASNRIRNLLAIFGLAGREHDRIATFSGGLRRRADIVRALLHAPPVLLLDEPTSGLDPVARGVFWGMIERQRREEGTTLVVATHVMDEADRCDQLAILDRGAVVAEGSPDQLKAELGEETLWLETVNPDGLAKRITTHFGSETRLIGSLIQISGTDVRKMLNALYQFCGDDIRSATVRRPTLEDVFMVHTGYELGQSLQDSARVEST